MADKRCNMKIKNLAQVFTSVLLIVMLLFTQVIAYALEVPVSQTEHEIDGKQTLVKVYEVSPTPSLKRILNRMDSFIT